MKNFKINKYKILSVILTGIILINITGCLKKEENKELSKTSETNENNNQVIKPEESKEQLPLNDNKIEEPKKIITQEEQEITTYFNDVNNEVKKLTQENNSEENENKLKGTFITIVDFLFYDAEINGVKFDDLSDNFKQSILETINDIDTTIMKKYPNYKETISEKTKTAYIKAGELISKGSKKISDFSKEKLGEENYSSIIEVKDEIKEYTKKAVSIVGEEIKDTFSTGKTKIKEWYQNFKQN